MFFTKKTAPLEIGNQKNPLTIKKTNRTSPRFLHLRLAMSLAPAILQAGFFVVGEGNKKVA